MSYSGETAYITGGAGGIARSLAERLVSKGMKVFIADCNIEGAQKIVNDLNKTEQVAWAVEVDVSNWESQRKGFEAAIQELGRINYVFPIAGIPELSWLPNKPNATEFEKPNLSVIDINLTGALYTSALAFQHFRRQKPTKYGYRGKVVIVASAAAFYYIPTIPIYTASKNAIIGFVRSFGEHLPREKITLNTICPNIVKTNISESSFYEKANEKGLLTDVDTLLDAFESLLRDSDTSGAAVEVLPGNSGWRIKENPEYTNEKCKESVDMARDPSHRSNKFHQPVVE